MKVRTHRFGEIEVGPEDVITFPEGLVGLSAHKRFMMLRDPESADLIWLQSVDDPNFALATIHHSKLGIDYKVETTPLDVASLQLDDVADAEAFVIINRVDGRFSVNLRGPIIVNASKMLGKQVVLKNPAYGTRRLLEIGVPEPDKQVSAS